MHVVASFTETPQHAILTPDQLQRAGFYAEWLTQLACVPEQQQQAFKSIAIATGKYQHEKDAICAAGALSLLANF